MLSGRQGGEGVLALTEGLDEARGWHQTLSHCRGEFGSVLPSSPARPSTNVWLLSVKLLAERLHVPH